MLANFVQGAEVHLHEHRDHHHPNQQAYWKVDLSHFHCTDGLKSPWKELTQTDSQHDAQEYPEAQVPFKHTHAASSCLARSLAVA